MSHQLLTVKDLSAFLGMHPNTIYKWKEQGKIPCVDINGQVRFEKAEIEKFIEKNKRKYTDYSELLPRLDISLAKYDKLMLKGESAVSKKRQRWNYGRKGVFKRKLKSGYSWCYWHYDEKGKIKKVSVRGATCREDAILAMEQKVREIFYRQHRIKMKSIKFREFAVIYLEKYAKPKKRSWQTDQKFLKGQLIPFFDEMELSEITPEHISDFIAKRKQDGVMGSTTNKHLQVLRKMMNLAIDYGYEVKKNPVRPYHFSSEAENQRTRVLSYEEEERLMKEAPPHLKPIIQCALLQGMRLQEILMLMIDDLDFSKDAIIIRPENNKTGKLDIIPIRDETRDLLKKLVAENQSRTSYVFNYLDPHTGKFRPIKSIQHAFQATCRRAKIEGLQFRDLRRTCATRLHENEVDPLIIQRLLRHSSFKISEQVYIQSSFKTMKEALKRADDKTKKGTDKLANLEHIWNTEKTEEKEAPAICLFSRN